MNASDIQVFCSTDETRFYIQKPFSRGEFTYATNGHVLIRIARLEDVPEVELAPHADAVFIRSSPQEVGPMPALTLPPSETEKCIECSEDQPIHDCPECSCSCDACDNTHEVEVKTSCVINNVFYDAKYIRNLQQLPGLRFALTPPTAEGGRFEFDGGAGYVMRLRKQYPKHVNADSSITVRDDNDED